MQIERQTLNYLFSKELYEIAKPLEGPLAMQEVCIICRELSESQRTFLGKILKAVKLDLDTVNLLDVSQIGACRIVDIQKSTSTKKVIVFGLSHQEVGLNLNPIFYQIIHFNNMELLFADQLAILEKNVQRKKVLWGQLKTLFGL